LRLRGGEGAQDISGDGGVLKEILVPGAGDELPKANDEVSVHYVGTLQSDGSQFDSSIERNAPFSFKLGQVALVLGQLAVCRGFWHREKLFCILKPVCD
jgi:hypothetical protein